MNYSEEFYKEQFQKLSVEHRRLLTYLVYKNPRLIDEYSQLFTQRASLCTPLRPSLKRTFVGSIRLLRSFLKVF